MDNERGFALGQLDRVQAMFPRVEGKASFLFALDVAMLAVVAVNLKLTASMGWEGGIALATIVILGVSLWKLFAAYAPNLEGASRKSLVYFRDVAQHTESAYCDAVKAATDADLIDDALAQVWRNSEILQRKFDRVQDAFTATMVSVPFWLIFLVATSFDTGFVKLGN